MRVLVCLVGAQGDAVARALTIGRRLRERGHELAFLGEFIPAVETEIARIGAVLVRQATAEHYDVALMASLGGPDRLGALARKLPTLLLVQECMPEVMSLKGDFIHWVTLFRNARAAVFMSEYQRDKVFGSFISGVDPSRLLVVPCGPEASALEPRQPKPKDYFGIVATGAVASHRRFQDVIAAGERLRDFNLQFTFVGDARAMSLLPEGTRKVIQRHPGRYVFTGAKSPAETLALIRQADLFCHAMIEDAWPQSVWDAAASGLPLMLSDVEAYSRDWTNGINCLKFPVNRPDFMASLMRLMLQDDVLRNSLAAAAQATARKYPVERFTSQVVQLLESFKR